MRAIPILILLFSISTSAVPPMSTPQKFKPIPLKKFKLLPDAFLNKLVENEATLLEKKKVLESIKSLFGVAEHLTFTSNLRTFVENDKTYDSFEHFGDATGMRAMTNLLIGHKLSKNKTNYLDFLDLVLKGGPVSTWRMNPTFSIWWFLHKTVEGIKNKASMEDIRFALANGHIEMENWLWRPLGLELIPEVVTTEGPTTEGPTTEVIVTSTVPSKSTDDPKRVAGGAGQSSYPPIDPDIFASLNTAGGHFIQPSTLPDGTPLSDLPEQYGVYKGVDDLSRVVANKHGYFVIHPVQTTDNKVMFDPYTIGQVMGYIYEYEQFKGVRPQDGWTVEMMANGKIPTPVKRSSGGAKSRRATLVFTKKSGEHE